MTEQPKPLPLARLAEAEVEDQTNPEHPRRPLP